MPIRQISFLTVPALIVALALSCQKKEADKPSGWNELVKPSLVKDTITYNRQVELAPDDYAYPKAGEEEVYAPSLGKRKYRPITVKYSSKNCSASSPGVITDWSTAKARIVHYMVGYETETKTFAKYDTLVNKWGSTLTMPQQEVTGRFYVKKIAGRWWIIDPDGYVHYMRGVTSFRQGSSQRNKTAFTSKYGDVQTWVRESRDEFVKTGIHATGAFSSGAYVPILEYDAANPDKPLTVCPSFAFLSKFRSAKGLSWPGNNSDYEAALVFHDDWASWCKDYVKGSDFDAYRLSKYTFGFFSDNEIKFNSSGSNLLKAFLELSDANDLAKKGATAFMQSKGLSADPSKATGALDDEFCGLMAEKYYSAVRAAVDAHASGLMYVGTRLHGRPKYTKQIVQAAGRHCHIVSINYYSRWAPELADKVVDWMEWSPVPFMVTEFYTKGIEDSDLPNTSGAGWCVPTQADRAYAYQTFTLGLLEATNCVGWTWFKYQDDDGSDNDGMPSNKGLYDNYYNMFPILGKFMREVNFNVYDLINYFDGKLD